MKLNPTERGLIERGVNHFRLVGPGLVVLLPWERLRARLNIGPNRQVVAVANARTREDVTVNVTVQVLYRVNPDLFEAELLPKLPALNDGAWLNILQWRTEAILRALLAGYSWRGLGREEINNRFERQLGATLADRVKVIGLEIMAVCLVRTELSEELQQAIIRAERDNVEAQGRARVLKEYFEIFGPNLPQAMPHIVQWELLNLFRKHGSPQLLLTAAGLAPQVSANVEAPRPVYQLELPIATSA